MLRSTLVFILMSLFAFVPQAKAGILIEPYLGYSFAGSGDMTLGDDKVESDFSSVTMGGRLGYQTLGVMFGLDYSFQSFDMTSTTNGNEVEDGTKKNQLGVFVGYDFPILLRAWATYYVNATMEGRDAAAANNQIYDNTDSFENGSGYALGVGFTGFPFLSINLEYRTIEYDQYEISGNSVSNYNEKLDLSEILLSVSVPFNL